MSHDNYLTADQIHRALTMRDLTDAAHGEHAMQVLLQAVVAALQAECCLLYTSDAADE